MTNLIKFTIVIATYNRSRLLAETLESISTYVGDLEQISNYQIIVVNNNSQDDTEAIVSSFLVRMPQLIVIDELKQGLSYARNTGIAYSKGEIVIFLDDDVELEVGWIEQLLLPFTDSSVGVVGGRVMAYGQQGLPDWLPREYNYLASVFDPVDEPCELKKVMGANFAVRKKIFDSVGGFDSRLGRKGNKLLGGEEVELFIRIRNAGYKIFYTPYSTVLHKISIKLNPEYIEDYAYWLGVSEAIIDKTVVSKLKFLLKTIRSVIFPRSFYFLQKIIVAGPASEMRYTIKKQYAKGYLSYAREFAR
jgi:GT2 family glycosyltransferase